MVYIFILFISYMLFVAFAAVVLLFSKLAETVVLFLMDPVFKPNKHKQETIKYKLNMDEDKQ
jgi:hypothetical protein